MLEGPRCGRMPLLSHKIRVSSQSIIHSLVNKIHSVSADDPHVQLMGIKREKRNAGKETNLKLLSGGGLHPHQQACALPGNWGLDLGHTLAQRGKE